MYASLITFPVFNITMVILRAEKLEVIRVVPQPSHDASVIVCDVPTICSLAGHTFKGTSGHHGEVLVDTACDSQFLCCAYLQLY